MRALSVKLWRDLIQLRGQAIAIGLVMACGVATLIMSLSMLDSMATTIDRYYKQSRFAQVFVHLERAPLSLIDRIAEVPGVAYAQARVIERVTLDMQRLEEPAWGRIVSLPEDTNSGLNLVHLRSGRYPEAPREVLVGQRFATAHGLVAGDEINAVLNGRREVLRVVGIGLSPEFVYLISPGSILPENERYGVFWMAHREMEAAFDMEGAFNDAILTLSPNAIEQEVIDRVDDLTERYGSLGAYGRLDQPSHRFLDNELKELRGTALIVPVIFLIVSAFLLNIVLARMIATQREQIAALKALGYSSREIGLHYLQFVLVIAVCSAFVGSLLGAWMGRGMTAMYAEFFDFPSFEYVIKRRVIVLGISVSSISATLGVASALYAAMRLPPAEAMRPRAPQSYRPTILERVGVHRFLPTSLRMIVRQLERQPAKTLLSILGVSLATAILVLGRYSEDAVGFIMDHQFNRVLRYDANVVLFDKTDSSAISTVSSMPGILATEPYRRITARIHAGHKKELVDMLALERVDGMQQLLDLSGRQIPLADSGILISSVLADKLDIRPGMTVTVEALEGRRPEIELPVCGVIDDFAGLSVYVRLKDLNRWLREQGAIGGIMVQVDSELAESLYLELKQAPRVVAVESTHAMRENFDELVIRNMAIMRPFLISFSVIIAFGVVYNSARISLAERSRDLSTLRVLGFSKREIASIQLWELALITGFGIPVGLVAGYLLAEFTSEATAMEIARMPFVIAPSTFGFSAVVVLTASIVSGLIVRRRLDRIDLIAVL